MRNPDVIKKARTLMLTKIDYSRMMSAYTMDAANNKKYKISRKNPFMSVSSF